MSHKHDASMSRMPRNLVAFELTKLVAHSCSNGRLRFWAIDLDLRDS